MIPGILKGKDHLQEEREDAVIREAMLWRNVLWVVVIGPDGTSPLNGVSTEVQCGNLGRCMLVLF